MMPLLPLCAFAFLAGFIDAAVGGGGLIQTPALLVLLPDVPIPTIFGTNKLASVLGTSIAAVQFNRHVPINRQVVLPAALAAFAFSFLGARAVTYLPAAVLRPLILALLIGVATYVFRQKEFGSLHRPRFHGRPELWLGILTGAVLGFYDGFFGPGTGSFLVSAFVELFGLSFLAASASAKVINVATNLSALLYFGGTGHILYTMALPMGICNILGSLAGARLAIRKGNGFIRILFLVVVSAIILKFAYDIFHG